MDAEVFEKLDIFFSKYTKKTYKKNDLLLSSGDDLKSVFFLKEGVVKEYILSKNGNELIVNIFKSGSFFPMSLVINPGVNQYFYETVTDCVVYTAPIPEVLQWVKTNPDVLYDLMRRVFSGMDGILFKMTLLMSGSAYSTVLAELLTTTKRFGVYDSLNNVYQVKISEKDLGLHSGTARETVSRIINQMVDKGLIEHSNQMFIIKDISKLEEDLTNSF